MFSKKELGTCICQMSNVSSCMVCHKDFLLVLERLVDEKGMHDETAMFII